MTSAIDTNVIVSLWDEDLSNLVARNALDAAMSRGTVVVSGAVYAELMGGGPVPLILAAFPELKILGA